MNCARGRRTSSIIQRLGRTPILFAVLATNLPMVCALVVSTQTPGETLSQPLRLGTGLLDNLIQVDQAGLGRLMLNSLGVALTISLSKCALSSLSAFALTHFGFPGRRLVFGVILLTVMLPEDVLIIGLYEIVVGRIGFGNSLAGVVFPQLASAFGVFLLHQHFSALPVELVEAAQIEGMHPFRYFMSVVVPLSWDAVGSLFVMMFIGSWNLYLWPLMVISDQTRQVVQVGLRSVGASSESSQRYGLWMLAAVLSSIPPLLVFLLTQEKLARSYTLSQWE